MEDTLLADKPETGGFRSALLEVDTQCQVECRVIACFRVVGNRQHQVRDLPPVIPETSATGGNLSHWTFRPEHEIHAGEQMHKQITRNTRAIVPVVVPPKET